MTKTRARRRARQDERTILRKSLLLRDNMTQIQLANKWGRSQSFVSQLITGTIRSEKYERKFAKMFGVSHSMVFPPTRTERFVMEKRAMKARKKKAKAKTR